MFNNNKTIIFISRQQLTVAQVSTTPARTKEIYNQPWTEQDLVSHLTKVKKSFGLDKARLLLGNDISYVLQFTIPIDIKESEQRQYILDQVKKQVPEEIQDHDWDYKVTGSNKESKKILAFVPVEDIFTVIQKAFQKSAIALEAIEPEAVANLRHKDPLIGIALKKDLKGKDAKVLNVQPLVETHSKKATSFKNKILIGLGLFLLLVTVTLSVFYYGFVSDNRQSANTEVTPALSAAPEATTEVTSTPTLEIESEVVFDPTTYRVQVLNGSGIAGEAGAVETLLLEVGFEEITTGNATSFETSETVVAIKDSLDATGQILELLKQALEGYPFLSEEGLSSDAEYDIIITVGEKS